MSTKIFPMRIYNPNKGRANVREAPPLPIASKEDRAIMRELIKEAQALALDKRVKALPTKSIEPKPLTLQMHFHKPEFVFAFMSLTRIDRKILTHHNNYKYMKEAYVWLKKFQKRAEHFCAVCGYDITARETNLVPYEIVIVEIQPLMIEGLCGYCKELTREEKVAAVIKTNNLHLL